MKKKKKSRQKKATKKEIKKEDFPEYTDESIKAANFIGLPFPYIPGDPGL